VVLAAVAALALAVSPAASQRAAKLAHRSILEYNAGDFAKALDDAKAAYEVDPRPALLFNLGQCHRAMGDVKQALFSYRGYLREAPGAPNRAAVLGLIDELEAQLKATSPTVSPIPPPIPTATPIPTSTVSVPEAAVSGEAASRPVPASVWWLGGSAVATGLAGTILGVVAASTLSKDNTSTSGVYTIHTISPSQYNTGQNEGLSADILWGVGGALLVTAVVVALAR
jgi:tetratricopeptide (TPR) repeat protein